ncbi:hypothetical protein FB45DRAFT_900396 [Roridomyces roridus]|uniref:Uncharacterized protein n=1 Tax=Roridomyces roridus TaxID=1738132 RepID=A0AAD7C9N5_9AGAR|nr:hypothetical protein FB45DRAFT_900396 [Roridomyces roridus]
MNRTSIRTLASAAARVRTRIVLDDLAKERRTDAVMNTHDWLGDDAQDTANRKLGTLNASKLQRTDFASLSNQRWPTVSFVPPNIQTPRLPSFPLRYAKKAGQALPFPEGTRGFLYYKKQLHLSPLAAGVRFRVTTGSHPSTFHDGHDLLLDGLPWQIPLHNIATVVGGSGYASLRNQLLRESLVDETQLERCKALTPNKKRLDHRLTVYTLNQPFTVDFSKTQFALIAGNSAVKVWQYAYTFADNRAQYRPLIRPYTGSALAQFERSTLPEHNSNSTLVMRIVTMLQEPECVVPGYDGYIPVPRAGELVHRPMGHGRGAQLGPWFCDTVQEDSDSASILRMLLDK